MEKSTKKTKDPAYERNSNWQGVKKSDEAEKEKGQKFTMDDLKGKKVDGDPEKESDQPLDRKYTKNEG